MSHFFFRAFVCFVAFCAIQSPPGAAAQPGTAPVITGRQVLRFAEPSPLSTVNEVVGRLDIKFENMRAADVGNAKQGYNLADIPFEVFVPAAYRPEAPHGLLVWVGVGPFLPAWYDALGRRKLIVVTANPADDTSGFRRARLALDVVFNMKQRYNIDDNRIYVSGFSAGAGLASHLVCGYPEVFRGGCLFMGGQFYMARKDAMGHYEPTLVRLAPAWKGPLEQLRKDLRLVLVRAEGDTIYSPLEDRTQYTALWLDGFERVSYLVVPGGGHKRPDAHWFEKALLALDAPPKAVPVTAPTKEPNPLPGQIGQAQRILGTALYNLEAKYSKQITKEQEDRFRQAAQDRARQYLQQVLEEYPTTPAAAKARQLLAELAAKKAAPKPAR